MGFVEPGPQRQEGVEVSRETVEQKARRYLTEGRLWVRAADAERIRAVCRGDGEYYTLGFEPSQAWTCNCPATNDRCCHLTALRLVTAKPGGFR